MIKIKLLILPKFEVGDIRGGFPGEAQMLYKHYLDGGQEYKVRGLYGDGTLYVKDCAALCVTGLGKVNAAISLAAVLADERFDFSEAFILSVGCAGASAGYGTMGDVYVITAAVDRDLGHHADIRELKDKDRTVTWFHDSTFDESAVFILDPELTDSIYELVKDLELDSTDRTRAFMAREFEGEAWAVREPAVLKGTAVTGDDYWKGRYGHATAIAVVSHYGCPDPYAVSEMEEAALANAAARFGLGGRFIALRTAVNMDVFMGGDTPDSLWSPEYRAISIASEDNVESADIFETAMHNLYKVSAVIADRILGKE